MLIPTLRQPLALLATAALIAIPSPLSDPVGVYAVVENVVFEGDAANPTAIQVWGRFVVTEQKPGDNYKPPVKGYLYYSVNATNVRATRAEWADLKGVAGSKALVGFGRKWQSAPVGRVRCATEKPAAPDEYPLGVGVLKLAATGNTGWPIASQLLTGSVPAAACGADKS